MDFEAYRPSRRRDSGLRRLESKPVPLPRPAPVYPKAYNVSPMLDSGRRRTESRYIKEPGKPRIKISHRRGCEYHKRSAYGAQHFDQTLNPGLLDTERIYNGRSNDGVLFRKRSVAKFKHVDAAFSSDSEDERSRLPSVGFAFNFFDPYENSQRSFAQISSTSLGRGRIRGPKSIDGNESKAYSESIIDVLSSRYVDISDPGQSCRAELSSQPQARASERGLQPLLTWM